MFRTAPEIAKWAKLIRRLSARLTRVVFAGLAVVSLACGTSFTAGSPATESDASNLGEDASEGDTSIIVLPPPQADAGAQRDGGMCMITTEPKDTPCLVDETYGVFVSASGHDSAAGTKADPIKTITAGITKTLLGPKRVFVCSGTYDEHLVVGASQDGVGVYGGFDCAGWTYQASNAAKVTPSTTGYALEVDSLTAGATFEDLEFDAQSGQMPGESSIAVFANQSVVTFRRVVMKAGDGVAGAGGDGGSNYARPQASSGNDADGGTGGAQVQCTCVNGDQSAGGAGGAGGPPSVSGLPGTPSLSGGQPGAGGTGACGTGSGGNGSPSPDAPLAAGATSHGALANHGWSAAAGVAGSNASIAQGGGGGGGNSGTAGRGGGSAGGCGGCGGAGGTAGRGGGASFALISYQSTIALDVASLTTGDGQKGGQGGSGQAGQSGGVAGSSSPPGCLGGTGGSGGGGSGGGGGAGGVSVAIGYVGTVPTQTALITKVGNFGTGGPGGAGGGVSNTGGKGEDGVAMAVLGL
jgi:hypothetical protein